MADEMDAAILNRPPGSGRSRGDTLRRLECPECERERLDTGRICPNAGDGLCPGLLERGHYCAKCRRVVPTTIIRGYNGARDHHRCEVCGRTWPR